ncbi:serine/arginine repetitive matrix protein 1-like [Hordeum vulgare subsp. vulgare]|uniref:serine/arginine repetitive matrix protein 1-like n=1 Tax=Hordeum vulgare subsp. vulgare TaxID=112509 RepID=UPI001D1A4ABC|nr:serine/arginine repetitive matrix protein 1-like [Hordeum vulgare subsp. vulgare]
MPRPAAECPSPCNPEPPPWLPHPRRHAGQQPPPALALPARRLDPAPAPERATPVPSSRSPRRNRPAPSSVALLLLLVSRASPRRIRRLPTQAQVRRRRSPTSSRRRTCRDARRQALAAAMVELGSEQERNGQRPCSSRGAAPPRGPASSPGPAQPPLPRTDRARSQRIQPARPKWPRVSHRAGL